MKKIIFLLLLISGFAFDTFSQGTSARIPEDGSAYRVNITQLVRNLTDAAGKDTVYISPSAHQNFYSINKGDTIKGSLTIGLQNVTKNGVTYTKTKLNKFDEVTFDYRSGGTIKDTLFFYGPFLVDSAGNGANSRIIIPVDATKKSYQVTFRWDGINLVQTTLFK